MITMTDRHQSKRASIIEIRRQSCLSAIKPFDCSNESSECDSKYIIVMSGDTNIATIEWLCELLSASLTLERITYDDDNNDNSDIILLVSDKHNSEKRNADKNTSHEQRVLLSVIEKLHSNQKEVLFGYPSVKLYPNQSIVQICERENICSYFALHSPTQLDELKTTWYQTLSINKQPLNEIRNYFGEKIAFYFAFLEFYTNSLLIMPALIGIFQYLFLSDMNIFCAVFNMLWIAIFLKRWKRRSNELAYEWCTISHLPLEGPRPAFRAKNMQTDPITKQLTPFYPISKTWLKEYGISLPFVLLSLFAAFRIMCLYFSVETQAIEYFRANPSRINEMLVYVPGIVYAIVVMFINHIYRRIVTKLNEWENHRTQSSHENHWIIKLVLFEFINNFMSLFYIGFYLRDLQMLKAQLATMLIVNQLVDNIQEVLIPIINTYLVKLQVEKLGKKCDLSAQLLNIKYQLNLPSYEGTYYDYLELYVQFGYVFLFASIFPLAPFIAFINNTIEIRSDAFKLCNGYRRPNQRFANSISGSWMKTFEVMAIITVITNCLLLSMSSTAISVAQYFHCDSFRLMVTFEHIVLALIMIIWYIVPDVPKHVNLALIAQNYDKSVK